MYLADCLCSLFFLFYLSRFLGTPFFHSMIARSQSFASDIFAFVDPETILLPDFISTLNYAYKLDRDWLLVASSRNMSYIPFDLSESKSYFSMEDQELTRIQKVLSSSIFVAILLDYVILNLLHL